MNNKSFAKLIAAVELLYLAQSTRAVEPEQKRMKQVYQNYWDEYDVVVLNDDGNYEPLEYECIFYPDVGYEGTPLSIQLQHAESWGVDFCVSDYCVDLQNYDLEFFNSYKCGEGAYP